MGPAGGPDDDPLMLCAIQERPIPTRLLLRRLPAGSSDRRHRPGAFETMDRRQQLPLPAGPLAGAAYPVPGIQDR